MRSGFTSRFWMVGPTDLLCVSAGGVSHRLQLRGGAIRGCVATDDGAEAGAYFWNPRLRANVKPWTDDYSSLLTVFDW